MRKTILSRPTSHWPAVLLLLAVVLPLYLAFRSISLDDFDAYSFALALRHFSLDLQQPQPPGFPVYVFLGRLAALGTDATGALTLLSALSGAVVVLCLYGLGQADSARQPLTGVGAALLVGLTPMGWLTAEKALSDAPGLALTLLSLWTLWRGRDDRRWFGLGCFVTGLGLGLRPQNGLPVLLLLAGLLIHHLRVHRSFRPLAWAITAFVIGILLWLLPTLRAVGGLSAYLAHLSAHSAHVRQADSLLAGGLPTWLALRGRVIAFADTLLLHTVGLSLYDPWRWPQAVRALAMTAILLPGLARADWRKREPWLLAAWAALVGGQIFLFEALDRPRLMLPLLPPLALLTVRGWARLGRPRLLPPIALTAAAFGLLLQGIPLAAQLASIPAPPAQAAAYVAEHYPPRETIVAAAGSFRAVQVDLPTYQLLYLYRFDPAAARDATAGESIRYVAVFDRDQFPDEPMAILSDDGRYVPLEDHTFARDPRVHAQHDQVRLQVLIAADLLPPEALAPPEGGCINVGGADDGRYLDRGWYRPETIGGVEARWAGGAPTTTVRLTLEPGHDYQLTLRALAYPDGQELILQASGRTFARFSLSSTWIEYTATLPASLLPTPGVTQVELIHTQLETPFAATGGASSDHRPLAAAYDWICLETVP